MTTRMREPTKKQLKVRKQGEERWQLSDEKTAIDISHQNQKKKDPTSQHERKQQLHVMQKPLSAEREKA